ncbi:hypothetical protein PFICI_00540 [Pestalotiopsis fici W106-1]|uniref:Uncharacterized protein n=1 Tax=Pestalotiopsis fici (strain W106-1 / CGMCC3.15140) TaxID=1229662 RepID=W3XMJ3_PESFW|nr:uncharacterized protein PFICI_00540 [Pestalotiopsis fici W106-1]ETS86712.1 hypothetical protein PFICI_00540 [Pestalotiopsis fici W106-1]
MAKKAQVPDAWEDDDWETQADKATAEPSAPEPAPASLSKRERAAQHAESNRRLWEAAEEPNNGAPLQYMSQQPEPPFAQTFKAPPIVLARKPVLAKRDPVTGGMAKLSLADDSDEEDKKPQETPEQIRARQKREHEEKQRLYAETRAKIFGESSNGGSGNSRAGSGRSSGATTPGTTTPPRNQRGRGRGRGGPRGRGDRNNHHRTDSGRSRDENLHEGTQRRDEGRERELYDPNYSPRPVVPMEQRTGSGTSGQSTPRKYEHTIRAPRGPDGSGRGGFGFARRGAKED